VMALRRLMSQVLPVVKWIREWKSQPGNFSSEIEWERGAKFFPIFR